jgi:DNA-binding protein H-NS
VAETTNKDYRALAPGSLVYFSVDELWSLREELDVILAAKIAIEMRALESRMDQLNPSIGTKKRAEKFSKTAKSSHRPYPAVLPKYRNPTPPFETWSGRGRKPRWVGAQLALGNGIENFRIAATETK